MKDRLPIATLLHEALARTGYDAVLLAEFLGERKLANLNKLIDDARAMDASGLFTLGDFITQLSEFVARQPAEPLAATQPESIDAVRLMTIHQAKGLEFPVVVVPDLDRPRMTLGRSVAFTPQLGPMVRMTDLEATTGYDLFERAENEEDLAELVRLFYVATTRAKDYLILSAGLPAVGSSRGPWTELVYRRFDPATGAPRGDGPNFRGHPGTVRSMVGHGRENGTVPFDAPVRVTASEPAVSVEPQDKGAWRDIGKLIEEARQMAARGEGCVPEHLAPVPPDAAGRRQFSFSRLSGAMHARDFQRPSGGDEHEPPASIDPLGLGTLVHAVLAELGAGDCPNFRVSENGAVPLGAEPDLAAVVRRHAYRHLPDFQGDLAEPIDMLGRFLASPRWTAVTAAQEVHAELEFLLTWPSSVSPLPPGEGPGVRAPSSSAPGTAGPGVRGPGATDLGLGSSVLGLGVKASAATTDDRPPAFIQGFIDCLYRDGAGGWHLVDYKTNRVADDTIARVASVYEMQMLVYALAIERVLGIGPQEVVLHFLRTGQEHTFRWDDAARARAVELVDRAMQAALAAPAAGHD
jgi:ATP-dependent helicase/nuclease subunit A